MGLVMDLASCLWIGNVIQSVYMKMEDGRWYLAKIRRERVAAMRSERADIMKVEALLIAGTYNAYELIYTTS